MAIIPRGEKFKVTVYDPAVKRTVHVGTADTMTEARQMQEDAEAAKNTETFVTPQKLTVAEFLENHWLPAMRLRRTSGMDACHYHAVRIIYGKGDYPGLGQMRLQKLAAPRITKFYSDMVAAGLSNAYIGHIHKSLKSALTLAAKYKLVVRNEAEFAERPPEVDAMDEDEELVIWQPYELTMLFEYLGTDWLTNDKGFSIEDRLCQMRAWYVQATTGLRRCEILPLRWGDVDLSASEVNVRRSLPPRRGGMENSAPKAPKSKSSRRTVALFPETVAVLREHKLAWQKFSATEGPYQGLVFCDQNGGPINPSRYAERLMYACKGAGVPQHRPHAFRHTHATVLLRDLGWDINRVKERLGHHSVTITEAYLHYVTKDQHDAIARNGSFLLPLVSQS